jgi:site-specific DNA-methyltransferase (adenine-specific)
MKDIDLIHGDCLEELPKLKDGSIDMVLVDPPYGTTHLKWDKTIDFNLLWKEIKRIIKLDAACVVFGTQPFTSLLICSSLEMYKYSWIWKKRSPTGFVNCNRRPMKQYEDICVFSKGSAVNIAKNNMKYFPQGLEECGKVRVRTRSYEPSQVSSEISGGYIQKYKNYPTNILSFGHDYEKHHPTAKPVALLEYLIKTYTQEGDTVLDFTMGSGSTGVACVNTNRKFIGIELDETYYSTAVKRIKEAKNGQVI